MLFKRHFSKNKKQKPVNFTYCKKSVKSYREAMIQGYNFGFEVGAKYEAKHGTVLP